MKPLAQELAPRRIRVNTISPQSGRFPMIMNEPLCRAVWVRCRRAHAQRVWPRHHRPSACCPFRGSARPTSATPCSSWPRTRRAMRPGAAMAGGGGRAGQVTTTGGISHGQWCEGKVAFITGRAQAGEESCPPARRGRDRHHRDRPCDDVRTSWLPAGHGRGPSRDHPPVVEALDRRVVADAADVRDPPAWTGRVARASPSLAAWTSSAPTPGSCPAGSPGRTQRAGVAGDDRRQPQRGLAHLQGRHPLPHRRRPGRRDRGDQLRCRA